MIVLDGVGSLYRQVYNSLRGSIISGALQAGEKLPSSREMAVNLGISRNTVVSCYEQLNAEGYIETRHGAGTFVAQHVSQAAVAEPSPKQAPQLSPTAQNSLKHWRNYDLKQILAAPIEINFQYGPVSVAPELLADINRIARQQRHIIDTNYLRPEGLPRLRASIARYVQHNRGCRCTPDNIVITNGSQQALDIIARMLLQPDDAVLIEEPAYRGATQAFSNVGATLIHSAVDDCGINPTLFTQQKAHAARLIYTTPSHQFPTGGVLPLARRLQLLQWAQQHNVFIIEDDYDSEFRYQGAPLESIQGLDEFGQTIYLGTFSKVLSPVLRVGYAVLPDSLVEAFTALKWCTDRHSALSNQLILAEFMDSPAFAKHLKRTRKIYAKRHDVLITALKKHFNDEIEIQGTNAGIHLLVWFKYLSSAHEAQLINLAAEQSLGLYTPTSLYAKPPKKLGLLLGYGNLSCEKIEQGVARLATIYQQINPSNT